MRNYPKTFFFLLALLFTFSVELSAQTPLKSVGPPAEKRASDEAISFNMLGAPLKANDFVSLNKLRKEKASTMLGYQINFSKFKRLKPNDVSLRVTLMRDGVKVLRKNFKHIEKTTEVELQEFVNIAEKDDSMIMEISGLPLKSTEKIRTIVFAK